jgi:hypothetical protein
MLSRPLFQISVTPWEGIHQWSQIILALFRRLCQQAAYKVNYLLADFLAIATQGLVNHKYWDSQILPRVYPPQRGFRARFCCLTGHAITTQQRSAI